MDLNCEREGLGTVRLLHETGTQSRTALLSADDTFSRPRCAGGDSLAAADAMARSADHRTSPVAGANSTRRHAVLACRRPARRGRRQNLFWHGETLSPETSSASGGYRIDPSECGSAGNQRSTRRNTLALRNVAYQIEASIFLTATANQSRVRDASP